MKINQPPPPSRHAFLLVSVVGMVLIVVAGYFFSDKLDEVPTSSSINIQEFDFNNNGNIENEDLVILTDVLDHNRDCPIDNCDVDGDGEVTYKDIRLLQDGE